MPQADLWRARSARVWSLDLSMLTSAGITATPPPAPEQRPGLAERALARVRRR